MSRIDWRTAGNRIRFQPRTADGNPDWNWVARRWKDEADYYAEELDRDGVIATAECPLCHSAAGQPCIVTLADFHTPRRRAAGEELLRRHGPRFTKGTDHAND